MFKVGDVITLKDEYFDTIARRIYADSGYKFEKGDPLIITKRAPDGSHFMLSFTHKGRPCTGWYEHRFVSAGPKLTKEELLGRKIKTLWERQQYVHNQEHV